MIRNAPASACPAPGKATLESTQGTGQLWLTLSSPFQLTTADTFSFPSKFVLSPLCYICFQCLCCLKHRSLCPPMPLCCALTHLLLCCPKQEGPVTPDATLLVDLPHLAPTCNSVFHPSIPSSKQKISLSSHCKLLFTAKFVLLNLVAFL